MVLQKLTIKKEAKQIDKIAGGTDGGDKNVGDIQM